MSHCYTVNTADNYNYSPIKRATMLFKFATSFKYIGIINIILWEYCLHWKNARTIVDAGTWCGVL